MKTRLAVLVAVLQIAVLAFMAGEREWVLRTGRTVWLRTAPIDPRDPMRGDYVRFNYELAQVPKRLARDGVVGWFALTYPELHRVRDRRVYALVRPDEEGIAQFVAVTDRRPESGEFVRGRVESVQGDTLRVRFGVEALFTEQGRARKFEEEQGKKPGVPLNIEAAVSDGGLAVMKGYRWEPLGINVTFERPPPPPARPAATQPGNFQNLQPTVRVATVELKNHSDQPVAIVVRPNAGSFRLVQNDGWDSGRRVRWVGEDAPPLPPPEPGMVKLLAPGESHRERIDFAEPQWFVRNVAPNGEAGEPLAWDRLANPWSVSMRFEYVPPTRAESAGLPHATALRHSRLRSRAFTSAGAVD